MVCSTSRSKLSALVNQVVGCRITTSGITSTGSRRSLVTRIDLEGFFVVHSSCRSRSYSLFGLQGYRQQLFLVFRFVDIKEQRVSTGKGFFRSSIVRVRDKV